jgi:hypothetical protein
VIRLYGDFFQESELYELHAEFKKIAQKNGIYVHIPCIYMYIYPVYVHMLRPFVCVCVCVCVCALYIYVHTHARTHAHTHTGHPDGKIDISEVEDLFISTQFMDERQTNSENFSI